MLRTTSRALLLSVAASAAVASSSIEATAQDRFQPTRSDKLVERAHRVRVRLEGDHARLFVEREVFNGGPRPDQAIFYVRPPEGGVATRLRTLGAEEGRPTWFEGELMEAEAAAAKYRELTGLGGYYPKDPALLSWRAQDRLALQVFPCMPGTSKKVDYELLVPATYEGGQWAVPLPRMGTTEVPAMATIEVGEVGGRAFVDGRAVGAAVPIRLDVPRTLTLAPHAPARLDGALASVALGAGRHAVRYHLEAAPRLSEAPRGARVVVAIDASHSLTDRQRDAELAAARAYLHHLRGLGARVAVTSFARRAEDQSGGFVDVETAIALLDARRFPLQNGSEVGAALVRARQLLDDAPAGAPKRLVLLSDLETRSSLDRDTLRAHLGPGTIAHFAVVTDGGAKARRDDAHAWAALPRSTGGLQWTASAPVDAPLDAEDRDVFAEWVRPRRIDGVTLEAPGGPPVAVPSSLAEGEGIATYGLTASALHGVTLAGELWSTPVRHTVVERPGDAARWAATIFGTSLVSSLTETDMMTLATLGRAVSPVTSYLAIEPGVRPSFEGLEEHEGGASGMGFGAGSGRLAGRAVGVRMGASIDRGAWLREALGKQATRCGLAGEAVTIVLETTRDEIVEVEVSLGSTDDAKRTCMIEGAWALRLPAAFDERRARFDVQL